MMKGMLNFVALVVLLLMTGPAFADHPGNIAVASNDKNPGSPVAERMGRSRLYLIYDGKGTFIKTTENPNFGKRERPEGTSMVDSLSFDETGVMTGGFATPSRDERQQTWDGFTDVFRQNGVTIVVAEDFGEEIVRGMRDRGIECFAFKGSAEQAVQSAIKNAQSRSDGDACGEKDEKCTVLEKDPRL
jgi:predicted Fe-Mo cluster-binding NifX family protein